MARPVTPKVAALIDRGRQYVRAGQFSEAARAFERALQQMPELAEVHAMRADALMRAGKHEAALGAIERALRLEPGWGEALMLRGNLEAMLARFDAAEASFREAMKTLGATPQLQANLGKVLLEQDRFADALNAFDSTLGTRDDAATHAGRARALYGLGRRDEAVNAWQAALEREPDSLEAMEQLMQLYLGQRRLDELERLCARAGTVAPRDATFHIGRAFVAWSRGAHEDALAQYREAARVALPVDPALHYEANLNEAMCLLALGRWREGWERYRWRLDREALRARYPRLAAEPAALAAATAPQRVRIHFEQGLGDELFFLRFAPYLRAAGHRLSYRAPAQLARLLAARRDLFEGVGLEDEADVLPCDVELQSSDLALASGRDFAPPLPLVAEAPLVESAAARLRAFGAPPYIGVTWAGGLTAQEQKPWRGRAILMKRIPVEELGRMLRPLRASIVVLQRKPDPGEAAAFVAALGRPALDATACNDDLREALAMLSVLQEYVGVSNTNMHLLAGLSGKPARVLVQAPADWRWAPQGERSPWFPDFTLHPQGLDSTWSEALANLQAGLGRTYSP